MPPDEHIKALDERLARLTELQDAILSLMLQVPAGSQLRCELGYAAQFPFGDDTPQRADPAIVARIHDLIAMAEAIRTGGTARGRSAWKFTYYLEAALDRIDADDERATKGSTALGGINLDWRT